VMRENRSRRDEKGGSHSKKEKGPRFHGTPLELARISHCHVWRVNAKFTERVGQALLPVRFGGTRGDRFAESPRERHLFAVRQHATFAAYARKD